MVKIENYLKGEIISGKDRGDLQWQRRKASHAVAAQESLPANAAADKKVKKLLRT